MIDDRDQLETLFYDIMNLQNFTNPRVAKLNEYVDEETALLRFKFEDDDDDENDYLKEVPDWTRRELLVTTLAAGSVGVTFVSGFFFFDRGILLSMFDFIIVSVFFSLGLIVPTYSAFQEQKITDCKAMISTEIALSDELGELKKSIAKLETMTGPLQNSVARMKDLKEALNYSHTLRGQSLTELEEQLEVSKQIANTTDNTLESSVLNNIFDIIVSSDKDADGKYSSKEISEIARHVASFGRMTLDKETIEDRLRAMGHLDLEGVFKIIKSLFKIEAESDSEEGKLKVSG